MNNWILVVAMSLAMVVLAAPAHAAYSDILTVRGGMWLEAACLSDEQIWQDECVEHVRELLDRHSDRNREVRRSDAFVACYFGELLTLRNVGIHSYRKILETLEWLDTKDGRVETAAYPVFAEAARDLEGRIVPARDAVARVRKTGWLAWQCYMIPTMWHYYWAPIN